MKMLIAILIIGAMAGRPSVGRSEFIPFESHVVIENGVIMGNTLPMYGILCQSVDVQGDPYPYTAENTLYSLETGETVRLRELGGEGNSWVMIKAANWIPLSSLCSWSVEDE